MKNKAIKFIFCGIFVVLASLALAMVCFAENGTLSVRLKYGTHNISDATVTAYKIAEIGANISFNEKSADEYTSYVRSNNVEYTSVKTDSDGTAELSLPNGYYLVLTTDSGDYTVQGAIARVSGSTQIIPKTEKKSNGGGGGGSVNWETTTESGSEITTSQKEPTDFNNPDNPNNPGNPNNPDNPSNPNGNGGFPSNGEQNGENPTGDYPSDSISKTEDNVSADEEDKYPSATPVSAKKIPQTGMLMYPVPLLTVGGIALIALGIVGLWQDKKRMD